MGVALEMLHFPCGGPSMQPSGWKETLEAAYEQIGNPSWRMMVSVCCCMHTYLGRLPPFFSSCRFSSHHQTNRVSPLGTRMHIWKAGLFLLFVICIIVYRCPTDRDRHLKRSCNRDCEASSSQVLAISSCVVRRCFANSLHYQPFTIEASYTGNSLTSGPSRSRFSTFPPGTHSYELQFARKVRPSSSAWLRGLALVQLKRDPGRYWLHARRASLTTPCSSCGQWHAQRIQLVASGLTGVPSGRPEMSARTTGTIQRNGLFPANCSTEQGSRARRTAPHWH